MSSSVGEVREVYERPHMGDSVSQKMFRKSHSKTFFMGGLKKEIQKGFHRNNSAKDSRGLNKP